MNHQSNAPGLHLWPPNQAVIEEVLNALPMGVRATLLAYPNLYVAGGFIRAVMAGEKAKDIDIFTSDLSVVEDAVDFYVRQCRLQRRAVQECETPCTITVRGEGIPVQFINNRAYAIEECIQKFDFTICQAALTYTPDGYQMYCTTDFIQDVALRRLVYTAPDRVEAPGGSLWRAFKFAQRGYSITQVELARLVVRLNEGLDNGVIEANPWTKFKRKTHEPDAIKESFSMSRSGTAVMGGDY